MSDLAYEKELLRRQALNYRKALSADEKATFDKKIENKLLNMWQYLQSDVILIYASTSVEVDTFGIIRHALAENKKVFLPRCNYSDISLSFYRVSDTASLTERRYGILEPEESEGGLYKPVEKALCIVPGLVFSDCGNRIGYGKGYYDRFLAGFPYETVGLCYRENVLSEVPSDSFDVTIKTLITQNEIISTSMKGGI